MTPVEMKDTNYWNGLDKDDETESEAIDGDIVAVVDGVAFLIQRKDGFNNIVCTLVDRERHSLSSVRAMFRLCIWLWEDMHIQYVRVEGKLKRYRFLEKLFPEEAVIRDRDVTDRNVFYCNLEEAHGKLLVLVQPTGEG